MRTHLRKSHGMEPNFVPNSTVNICRVTEGINGVCEGQNRYFYESPRLSATGDLFFRQTPLGTGGAAE